jgi:hypothetical protein
MVFSRLLHDLSIDAAQQRKPRLLKCALIMSAALLLATTMARAQSSTPAPPQTDPTQPSAISAKSEAPKPILPEDLLQGTIQERRARRKACATQWEHMKHTKGTDGQTWRDFTLKCYGDNAPLQK